MPAGLIVVMVFYILNILALPFAFAFPESFRGERLLALLLWFPLVVLVFATFTRQRWAWWGLIIIEVIAIFWGAVGVHFDAVYAVTIIASVAILWYLGTPQARMWFGTWERPGGEAETR